MEINQITDKIIGCAIEVHKYLGPELLESAYEECLAYELRNSGLTVERQKPVPVIYKEIKLDWDDLYNNGQIINPARAGPLRFAALPMTDFLEVPVEVVARDSSLRVGMTIYPSGRRGGGGFAAPSSPKNHAHLSFRTPTPIKWGMMR